MQRVTGYLLTPKDSDFYVHDIYVARGKTLPDFIMSSLLHSKTDIGLKHLFSLIMLGMVTL